MARYTGETIKVDNAVAVFKAVAEYGCVTRSDISAHTGLSIVTAGKATEEFLDREIFIQKESQSKTIGRHASRLSLDRNKLLVLLDISNKDFVVNYYDLSLNCVFTNKHSSYSKRSWRWRPRRSPTGSWRNWQICIWAYRACSMLPYRTQRCPWANGSGPPSIWPTTPCANP